MVRRTRPSLAERSAIIFTDLRSLNALFSLPLAYIGMLLALRDFPTWHQLLWISLAVIGARTFGHAVNMLADRDLDALHPAKRTRSLPAGLITAAEMLLVATLSAGLFLFSAYQLNTLAALLAPGVLAYLVFYSYTKRFTWATHLFMGATTGTAIAGGWVGVTGSIGWEPAYLLVAAFFWVAGFDLLLATLDYDFDIQHGLHSMVRRWGVGSTLWVSRGFYALAGVLFLGMGPIFGLDRLFFPFWGAAVASLAVQHWVFDPKHFARGQQVFFRFTALFSVLLSLGVVAGLLR